ncbi:hypothetical protein PGH07_07825 [Sulfurovum sp. zt1-1]|uniref:Head decoration protein n=1 Tax=Sulfurovum zhangzhouensis TaxID=3019067 RepID=A0ABT7QZ06_9BACT|nr:hypothetical protein [Sulfurovum zhangzhouensis]MDM5272085.1 hypothetical protein [Sulfurovum zhangzhouensis]
MAQPAYENTYDPNGVVLSEWRVDGERVLVEGTYTKGSVLGAAVGGNYELTATAAEAESILLADITVPTGETRKAPVVEGGEVAEDALVLGGTLTIADVKDVLRDKNIYIKKRG